MNELNKRLTVLFLGTVLSFFSLSCQKGQKSQAAGEGVSIGIQTEDSLSGTSSCPGSDGVNGDSGDFGSLQGTQEESLQKTLPGIYVYITGAVETPGVYELPEGSRVKDLIEMAGGFTEGANVDAVNLAAVLSDEMHFHIPLESEEDQVLMNSSAATQEGKININQATADQLSALSGIGPAKAEAIVAYRKEHGAFQSVEDLLEVSGIGSATLEKIRDQIRV